MTGYFRTETMFCWPNKWQERNTCLTINHPLFSSSKLKYLSVSKCHSSPLHQSFKTQYNPVQMSVQHSSFTHCSNPTVPRTTVLESSVFNTNSSNSRRLPETFDNTRTVQSSYSTKHSFFTPVVNCLPKTRLKYPTLPSPTGSMIRRITSQMRLLQITHLLQVLLRTTHLSIFVS
jgi:hypothetical protein